MCKHIPGLLVLLLLMLNKTYGQKKEADLYSYTLKKIKEGIYVSERPEPLRETVDGNFTIIINDYDVIVIDASLTLTGARNIIKDIKKLTNKPVKYLINTHFHGDHTFGNQAFKKAFPGIEIIATKETAEVMQKRVTTFKSIYINDSSFKARRDQADSQIRVLTKLRENEKVIQNYIRYRDHDIYVLRESHKGLVITPPTVTFEREFIIKRSDKEIKVMFLGKGDTPGDAWIFLPKEKILIAGDALPHPVPFGFTNTPGEWINTLEKAAALDFEILIPGHGEVQYDKKYMRTVIQMLRSLQSQITASIQKGFTIEQIKQSVDIKEFEEAITGKDNFLTYYFNEYFKDPIVGRFYNEIKELKKN